MSYFLGADIGSVNARLSLIEEGGTAIHLEAQKITSNARDAVARGSGSGLYADLDLLAFYDFRCAC